MNAEQTKQFKAVMGAIRKHRRFTVSSHVNPEGDALGSALALASLINRLGKQAVVATDGGIPPAFEFFPKVAKVVGKPSLVKSPEVAMTVDVPVLERLGSMTKVFQEAPLRVVIDHHVSNRNFGDINWVDPKAAAVGEQIFRLYEAFKVTPTRDEALCMYVSIVTDTGSFRYMSTTPEVHRIAAALIGRGVSPLKVAQDIYECHSPADLRFLGKVLTTLKSTPDGKISWVEVPYKLLTSCKPGPEIIDELVNYPRSVQTAEVSFVLRQQSLDGKIRTSFRSKGRVDVNQIARSFGGGGHRAASGCTVEGTLPQAREKVLQKVRQALRK